MYVPTYTSTIQIVQHVHLYTWFLHLVLDEWRCRAKGEQLRGEAEYGTEETHEGSGHKEKEKADIGGRDEGTQHSALLFCVERCLSRKALMYGIRAKKQYLVIRSMPVVRRESSRVSGPKWPMASQLKSRSNPD